MSLVTRKQPEDFHSDRLERFDAGWTKRALDSGLTALHVPLQHDDHFFLGVVIKAGSRLELKHPGGISHFLEHMMFRGSARHPEFTKLAEAFEWLGGDWNAATGHEHTEYWYSGIRHTAKDVIELFADFLAHPKLTDIEIERQIILRELDGETNDHGHCTDLDYHVATLFWPGSSLAQPILGTRESLAKIDQAALHKYRDAFYVPRNMAVCAVGGDQTILQHVTEHFSGLRRERQAVAKAVYPGLPKFRGPAVKWVEHSDNEYEIRLSFLTDGEWSEDAPAYELITRILSDGFSSRLARRLREELGLVYDIGSHTSLGIDAGSIDITAACAQDQLDEFLKELFLLLKTFVKEGPTNDELQRAVVRGIVDLELSPSVPENIGAKLAWAAVAERPFSLVRERERLKALTVEHMAALCRAIFRPEQAALVVLGPSGKDIEGRLKRALAGGL